MKTSPLADLHAAHETARVVPSPSGEGTEVLTYGDVPAEVAAAGSGALMFDRTTRGLLVVGGSDATDFLHRILANTIKGLEPNAGNANMLLTGKGKIVEIFDLAFMGEGYLLSTPPGRAETLRGALDMFLFAEPVELEDATETYAPIELVGPKAGDLIVSVIDGVEALPESDHVAALGSFEGTPVRVVRVPVAGHAGFRLEGEPTKVQALWQALAKAGARPGGRVAFDSLRAETVTGVFGTDITDDVYPQEARLDDAFSLTKGCYIGQEVVAKIDTYGGLNKRLFRLRVDSDDPVQRGTRILRRIDDDVRDVGVTTSWAYSFAADGGVVLGYVKRKHQEPGTEFRLGEDGPRAVLDPE